jgi:hypothetical protein
MSETGGQGKPWGVGWPDLDKEGRPTIINGVVVHPNGKGSDAPTFPLPTQLISPK